MVIYVLAGNKSEHGALMAARLLTVTRTCQMQKRKPLEFLVQAVVAHRSLKPAPTLMMTDE